MSEQMNLIAEVRDRASAVNWPEPVEVRTRGERRARRRRVVAGAAAVAIVLAAAGYFAIGTGPGRPAPVDPAAAAAARLSLDTIAVAPSGTVFAITHACGRICTATTRDGYTLLRSNDLARSWTTVGPVPGVVHGIDGLAVASDRVMWLEDGTALLGTADGGKHWNRWELGDDPTGSEGSGLAGTTLCTVFNGQVVMASDGGPVTPTTGQPPGQGSLDSLAAISADRAIVLRAGDHPGWYRTADRGATWTPASDPCAGLSHPNIAGAKMGAGRQGGLWAICFVANGDAPRWQIATSSDEGYTWQPHPGGAPGGDDVSPVSASVAWRTGSQSDVYRSTDAGAHWTDVARLGPGQSLQGGFVLDANTALYVTSEAGNGSLLVTLHRTTDGGRTWTALDFGR